jgi:hypothetical protein
MPYLRCSRRKCRAVASVAASRRKPRSRPSAPSAVAAARGSSARERRLRLALNRRLAAPRSCPVHRSEGAAPAQGQDGIAYHRPTAASTTAEAVPAAVQAGPAAQGNQSGPDRPGRGLRSKPGPLHPPLQRRRGLRLRVRSVRRGSTQHAARSGTHAPHPPAPPTSLPRPPPLAATSATPSSSSAAPSSSRLARPAPATTPATAAPAASTARATARSSASSPASTRCRRPTPRPRPSRRRRCGPPRPRRRCRPAPSPAPPPMSA